jgi:thioredoxin-like negative regulator of GroEL
MLRQFNRLIALALLIAVTLYITLTNSETATIKLGPNITVTTYAGVIYLGVFFIGCVVASVVALFFGFKSFLRERKLRAAARSHQLFFDLFLKARSFMASEEWSAARALWEQVLQQDPGNTIARVELATCVENLGDAREALKVLDTMRASNHMNAAVLFKAVELNRKLGNNTAAKDNLALIVQEAPTKRALELARDIAEELGRIDDAMDYQRSLEKIGHISEEMVEAKTRLSFAQLVGSVENENSLRETLTIFVKKNPTFVPALERLAQLEIARGRLEEGAELLVKAAPTVPSLRPEAQLRGFTGQNESTRSSSSRKPCSPLIELKMLGGSLRVSPPLLRRRRSPSPQVKRKHELTSWGFAWPASGSQKTPLPYGNHL